MGDTDSLSATFHAVAQSVVQRQNDVSMPVFLVIGTGSDHFKPIDPGWRRGNTIRQRLQHFDLGTVDQSLQCHVFSPQRIGLRRLFPTGAAPFDSAHLLTVDSFPARLGITVLLDLFGKRTFHTPRADHLVVSGNNRRSRSGPEIEAGI